ncbi:MAG: DNA-binding transcriptional LysR family regulator [Alteromonadaceae bacterium]|jgi:DNA-binding transcriptional LysR family regulator
MDLKEIKAFIILSEELNFGRAAQRLNITQPPLTRMISKLENKLGVTLLTRTTRKVELTDAGIYLTNEGQEILDKTEKLEKELQKISQHKFYEITIGIHCPSLHSAIPQIISSFTEQFPQAKINVLNLQKSISASLLIDEKTDIVFTTSRLKNTNVNSMAIEQQPLGFLINNENPLSNNNKIQLSDLKGETLISHKNNGSLGFQIDFFSILEQQNIHVEVLHNKEGESCPYMVILNKGLLLSTRNMAFSIPNTTFVPLINYSKKLQFYASWNKNNDIEILQIFLTFMSSTFSIPSPSMSQ